MSQPLRGRFKVTETTGEGGLPKLEVLTPWSRAEIYLHGAHLSHFQRLGEEPLLFLSRKAVFDGKKPIRGGVPVIFPWFGPKEGSPSHGFARTTEWIFAGVEESREGAVTVRMELPEMTDPKGLPSFSLEYILTIGEHLQLELRTTNGSDYQTLDFENCLHTYLHIGDIRQVSVTGLQGREYLDNLEGLTRKTETPGEIRFDSEVDRVYVDTPDTVEITDPVLKRRIMIEKENSLSTVVWNPWVEKSAGFADMAPDEYAGFVCVESGNAKTNRVQLTSG
ncbi:MAG: D-hexose-6-phosphate mutarotase, partial [Verrucomicrobiae bacterium]|nr:D-hexose-6-phosphate mutarotase [Verrucomicrobiae bacterium]